MEHTQSAQDEPNQVRRRSQSKSGLIGKSNLLIYLLTRHPGLLLIGLLTMLIGTAALALYSLGYAGSTDNVELVEEIPAVVAKPIIPSENSNPTPLWLIAAIAFSCASGCFIIVRLVNGSNQSPQVRKPIKRDTGVRVASQRERSYGAANSLTPNHSPEWKPTTLKSPPVFVPLQPLKPMIPKRAKPQPIVTVVPSKQKHPLDKSKETLADLMDIRKQTSLSTILQKY